ncbi:hypothetical protein CEXT_776791 [Caerostris extrusa]|uniref:Uncharacterized protein n=1 Tax=Caerostris extrusa TaxID=172846 RepID=A0AAV4WHR2_CAEEX|nr:hypothetical protein CEXT_776791 [Caerostris extrusa]
MQIKIVNEFPYTNKIKSHLPALRIPNCCFYRLNSEISNSATDIPVTHRNRNSPQSLIPNDTARNDCCKSDSSHPRRRVEDFCTVLIFCHHDSIRMLPGRTFCILTPPSLFFEPKGRASRSK